MSVSLDGATAPRLNRQGRRVVIAGPLPRPNELFETAGMRSDPSIRIANGGLAEAVEMARELLPKGA